MERTMQQLCIDAHKGTSFNPERRGETEYKGYLQYLSDIEGIVNSSELLDNELYETFKQKFTEKYRAYLCAQCSVMSTMITGPANFPVARNQKKRNTADNRWKEAQEYYEYFKKKLWKLSHPEARPIMAGDDDAVSRLEEKLIKAEQRQEMMKAANKVMKSKKLTDEEKTKQVMEICTISEQLAHKLVTCKEWYGPGFARFELTNNGAKIRNDKKRLERLKRDKEKPVVDIDCGDIRIEEDRAANRVRIFFPDKPEYNVRSELKRHGYRWSPSNGAWQAFINSRSVEYARTYIIKGVG